MYLRIQSNTVEWVCEYGFYSFNRLNKDRMLTSFVCCLKTLFFYFLSTLDKRVKPIKWLFIKQDFTQGLIQRQTQIDNVLLKYIANEEKYFVSKINDDISKKMEIMTSLLKLSHIRKTIHADNYAEDSLQLFKHIIKQAKIRVSKWGGELYFVYLPDYRRYTSLVTDGDTYKERRKVFSMISKLGIPIIDIHDDVFSKHPDIPSLFPLRVTSNHYNAEGYNEVAKAIVTGVNKYEQSNK